MLNSIDCVPSNVQFSHQEALLYVFEDNEAVIKMILKGRSPTMRHVSRIHRVALDWLFDRINLDPKIQIKNIDTKNQLAKILTSSTNCLEVMSKSTQEDTGEERVTAKSRPMMSLIARAPSNLSSSTSESPGKRSNGNQDLWSAKAEREERTGELVVGSDPKTVPDYYHEQFFSTLLKVDDNKAWSSQEWKATHRWVIERSNPL